MSDTAGGALISGLFGIYNNSVASRRESTARHENFALNELAAENADKRTRALYYDLYSPQAQMQQIKEAGLSPSLFYGNLSGMSGQAGAQGAGVSGVNPNTFGIDPLTASQISLNNAQAKKANAQAKTESGENERGIAEIANLWAELGATKASEALLKAQEKWQTFTNTVNEETKDAQIWRIKSDARRAADEATTAYWEAENAGLQFMFNKENYSTELQKSKKELALLIANENLSVQEANKIVEETILLQDYEQIAELNAESYAKYVEAFCDNLPKQLDVRKQELNVEKWRIGVGAFTETVRTIGYLLGAQQLGDGGQTIEETVTDYDKKGHPTHTKQTNRSVKKMPRKIR